MNERDSILEQAAALADQAHGLVHDPQEGLQADASFVLQVEALRLTILAATIPDEQVVDGPLPAPNPPLWARVELFGHTVRYGQIHEVEYAGKTWIDLVEPALWNENQDPGRSGPPAMEQTCKRYHPNAIYAIEERSEVEIIETLQRIKGLDRIPVEDPPAF